MARAAMPGTSMCVFNAGSGGGSFETPGGAACRWALTGMCSFIGTGASQYSFSGVINAEGSVTTLEGARLLIENGVFNGGQINAYDVTSAVFTTGTGARAHLIAPNGSINGKNNTSKLAVAGQSSQIVTNYTVSTGGFFTAASTSDANPIECGVTSGAVACGLDANMNGVFQTQ